MKHAVPTVRGASQSFLIDSQAQQKSVMMDSSHPLAAHNYQQHAAPAVPVPEIIEYQKRICYSEKYYDDEKEYEYRHVIMPKKRVYQFLRENKYDFVPTLKRALEGALLSEYEWRAIGLEMSPGWIHYAHHRPEPHVLLFRRPATSPPQ